MIIIFISIFLFLIVFIVTINSFFNSYIYYKIVIIQAPLSISLLQDMLGTSIMAFTVDKKKQFHKWISFIFLSQICLCVVFVSAVLDVTLKRLLYSTN